MRIFQHPSVENCEQGNFFALGLEFDDHLLCNLYAVTHSAQTEGSVGLHAAHGSDVLLGQFTELFLLEGPTRDQGARSLKLVDRLLLSEGAR